jgi:hypothetical protein
MKLQLIHCAVCVFEDQEMSKKPRGIKPKATRHIAIEPTCESLSDPELAQLASLFENIKLDATFDSPIQLRRDYLQERLDIEPRDLKLLLDKGRASGILRQLTIKKDYRSWLRRSRNKGCLLVMTCIEKGDHQRDDLVGAYCRTVMERRDQLISLGHELEDVIVMPNAHLTNFDELETDSKNCANVIKRIKKGLHTHKLRVFEGSFGYGKQVRLVIMGHPKAYSFRQL